MRTMLLLAIIIGLATGALLAAQPGVNGELGRRVAHPLQASLISFGTGLLILVAITIVAGVFPPKFTTPLAETPWWAWFGGAIGTVMVTASLIFAPQTGALIWIGLIVTGQIFASLLLDHFGLVGYRSQPVNAMRLIGAILLVVGVLIVLASSRR